MCDLCKNIPKTDEEFGNMRMDGKENIIFSEKSKFHLFADTGDSFCPGIVNDINYCPMCGRKLVEE